MLQEGRKTTAKMKGLCEDRSINKQRRENVERKCQHQEAMEIIKKIAVQRSDN